MADTSYSDPSAADNRGGVVSEVLLVGTPDKSRVVVHGILLDGELYWYSLGGNSSEDDPFIGREIDGWWIKARLCNSSYLMSKAKGYDRYNKRVSESYILEELKKTQ